MVGNLLKAARLRGAGCILRTDGSFVWIVFCQESVKVYEVGQEGRGCHCATHSHSSERHKYCKVERICGEHRDNNLQLLTLNKRIYQVTAYEFTTE